MVLVTPGNVFLIFTEINDETRDQTHARLVGRNAVMETGGNDNVLAIYELNSSGQFRQVRVETTPVIRTGEWNVTMALMEHRTRYLREKGRD
jgi:hypothetical protein